MKLPPIVDRELRVACRRPSYIRSRLWVGAVVIGVAAILLGIHALQARNGGASPVTPGKLLFEVFKWLSFAAAAFSGVILTADCLSDEKREGTLGLLFLTELRGYDVILGKLATHSLHAVYAYLAAFPVVGSCFVMGGVSGGEFVKLLLVLFLTLFLSLSVGLLVSALCRETIRAMSLTLGIILFLVVGLAIVDGLLASRPGGAFGSWVTRFCPSYALWEISYAGNPRFFQSVTCLSGLALAFLVASCVVIPSTWQSAPGASGKGKARSTTGTARSAAPQTLRVSRRAVLERDPIEWLARNVYPAGWFVWGPVLGALAVVVVVLCLRQSSATPSTFAPRQMLVYLAHMVLTLFTRLWLAIQAVRFWTDARGSGAMELLLVTPIRPNQIVAGHWRALCRTFLPPVLILVFVSGALGYFQMEETLAVNRTAWAANPNMASSEVDRIISDLRFQQLVTQGFDVIQQLSSFWAVAWMGIWMGMITRRTPVAVGKTLLFADFLPIFIVFLLNLIAMAVGGPGIYGNILTVPVGLGLIGLAMDALLAWIARRRAYSRVHAFAGGNTRESRV